MMLIISCYLLILSLITSWILLNSWPLWSPNIAQLEHICVRSLMQIMSKDLLWIRQSYSSFYSGCIGLGGGSTTCGVGCTVFTNISGVDGNILAVTRDLG